MDCTLSLSEALLDEFVSRFLPSLRTQLTHIVEATARTALVYCIVIVSELAKGRQRGPLMSVLLMFLLGQGLDGGSSSPSPRERKEEEEEGRKEEAEEGFTTPAPRTRSKGGVSSPLPLPSSRPAEGRYSRAFDSKVATSIILHLDSLNTQVNAL